MELKIWAIEVPRPLLYAENLTPAAKFLWIRMRLDELRQRVEPGYALTCLRHPHQPRRMVKCTHLARSTVYEAMRQLVAAGWLAPYNHGAAGMVTKQRWQTACPLQGRYKIVRVPTELIRFAHALRPQAILCFGMLQTVHDFNRRAKSGTFKWAELRAMTRLHVRTLKRAVRALVESRWVSLKQEHRKARVQFALQHADYAQRELVRRHLERAQYRGEALMQCFLSTIADTQESQDNARPEFLVNPVTRERMEFDRYYPMHGVAFEFNGSQHYKASERFSKQEVEAQRKRDVIKRRICREKNIKLVVVRAEDLTLAGMLKKVGDLLPRKALRGFRRTIQFLNQCGLNYQLAVARAGGTM